MTNPVPVFDPMANEARINILRERGVQVWGSERVFVANDVPLEAICPGAILMNAMISGPATSIGAGSVIGSSGMARLHDACLGRGVELGAGSYEQCVLFDSVNVRGFAELRTGTILEQHVRLGHNVGLKNSLLAPWTTAGSCVNFCDVVVFGGTDKFDHSEIGSGAVHFNFSPRRDKFGSCLGDIRGLLLRARPVFVGGNTGIVAPCEFEPGQVLAAGVTLRQFGGPAKTELRIAAARRLIRILEIVRCWYDYLRLPNSQNAEVPVLTAAIQRVRMHRLTRIAELKEYASRRHKIENWGNLDELERQQFLEALGARFSNEYVELRRTRDHIGAIKAMRHDLLDEAEAGLTMLCTS